MPLMILFDDTPLLFSSLFDFNAVADSDESSVDSLLKLNPGGGGSDPGLENVLECNDLGGNLMQLHSLGVLEGGLL